MERLRKNKKSGSNFSDVFGLIFLVKCRQDLPTLSLLHYYNGTPDGCGRSGVPGGIEQCMGQAAE